MTIDITKQEINDICQDITGEQLKQIETFVIFLGHAHSGHSIIGAMLDAHPDVAIANEINVPKILVDHKLNKAELSKITLFSSLYSKSSKEWLNTGYKYNIPNGFQGKTTHPKVLGDKKGGGSTRIIRNNPHILNKLIKIFGKKLKFINVVRNPMDNIAAFAYYWKEPLGLQHVKRYYENLETNLEIEKKYPNQFYKIRHQEFIKNPKKTFSDLLRYLDIMIDTNLIEDSISIVRENENERSKKIKWPILVLNEIKNKNNLLRVTDKKIALRLNNTYNIQR
jgi:hypothetical protein